MKICVKTLKGDRFEIQVKPEDSVADVKKIIETVLGATAYPAAEQVLIHKGKVLKDDTTLEANNVSEKSIIGVMKVHATPPSSTPAALATSATESPASGGALYVASERVSESSIQRILGMVGVGWKRDMVTFALYLAYDDIDKALEYLYFGLESDDPYITEDETQEPELADLERLLDLFNDTPEYEFLRAMVQSDPSIVKDFVEMLGEQDPPLFHLIQDNKAVFLRLLLDGGTCGNEKEKPQEHQAGQTNEPNNGGDGENQVGESDSEETEVKQPQELQADQANKPNKGGDGYINNQLTTKLKSPPLRIIELIEQLEALGFERGDAVGAYFASNRNVQVAANRLLGDKHESQE